MQTSINMKVYLDMVRVLFGDQKASICCSNHFPE